MPLAGSPVFDSLRRNWARRKSDFFFRVLFVCSGMSIHGTIGVKPSDSTNAVLIELRLARYGHFDGTGVTIFQPGLGGPLMEKSKMGAHSDLDEKLIFHL
jgi:hypothetical protein